MTILLSMVGLASAGTAPSVYEDAVFGVNMTKGVVYAQGLYCDGANFSQTSCAVVNREVHRRIGLSGHICVGLSEGGLGCCPPPPPPHTPHTHPTHTHPARASFLLPPPR